MALTALTTYDVVEYVSDLDPAKTRSLVADDPKNPQTDFHEVVNIDYDLATVFKVRALDVFLMGHIYDNAQRLTGKRGEDEVGIHTQVNQTNINAVRHGLVSVTNFKTKKGKEVKVTTEKSSLLGREYDVVTDDVLNQLGLGLIGELASKIKEISEVSAEEVKNSDQASLQLE